MHLLHVPSHYTSYWLNMKPTGWNMQKQTGTQTECSLGKVKTAFFSKLTLPFSKSYHKCTWITVCHCKLGITGEKLTLYPGFLLNSPAFSGIQTPQVIILFFLTDRPTHHHKRLGDGKQNIFIYFQANRNRNLLELTISKLLISERFYNSVVNILFQLTARDLEVNCKS